MKISTLAAIAVLVLCLIVIVRMVSFPATGTSAGHPTVAYTKSPPGPPTPDLPPTPDVPDPTIPEPPGAAPMQSWPEFAIPIGIIGVLLIGLQLVKESKIIE